MLVLALGFAADWIASMTLALQADALAIAAIAGLFGWDLWHGDWHHRTPLLLGVALLYCGMWRKAVAGAHDYVPAAYSWAAAAFLPLLALDIFNPVWFASGLVAMGVVLFEIGRYARKGFLRWQGYAMLGLAFANFFVDDLSRTLRSTAPESFSLLQSVLLETLILAAAGYWLYERTRNTDRCARSEHLIGLIADVLGTSAIALWFEYRFPSHWVPVENGALWITAIWAAMATVLMALAWIMRRRTFMLQGVALAVAAVLRGVLFDLTGESHADFWHGSLYHLSVAALVLMAGLPFAFKLRGREFLTGASF
jgi:hypothetical protein